MGKSKIYIHTFKLVATLKIDNFNPHRYIAIFRSLGIYFYMRKIILLYNIYT